VARVSVAGRLVKARDNGLPTSCRRCCTALAVTAFAVLPADARAKKKMKYRADTTTLSLDGRNTGRARTCGFDTFLYDGYGVPVGPYCHSCST
jgi:hypothetical protein